MSQCQVSGLLSLDEALEKLLEKPVAITDTLVSLCIRQQVIS